MLELLKDFNRNRIIKNLNTGGRVKKIKNLSDIKSIGIIFEIGSEQEWNTLYYFITTMEKQGKKVNMIGYQPKKLEMNYIITPSNAIICKEKEDTNFYGKPKEELISNFVDKEYELLIDMTKQPHFFGQYISLRTKANLKIAHKNTSIEGSESVNNIYDLIIESQSEMDNKEYLNNVINYLSIIKK